MRIRMPNYKAVCIICNIIIQFVPTTEINKYTSLHVVCATNNAISHDHTRTHQTHRRNAEQIRH